MNELLEQWKAAHTENEVALIAWQTAPKLADGGYDWPLYYDYKTAEARFQRIDAEYQHQAQQARNRELELRIELAKIERGLS